jgi:RNA polymerase-binding transcription factor DksA
VGDDAPALSSSDRAALEALIATERDKVSAQADALQRDFDAIVDESALGTPDDEHDPEGATLAFERSQIAALLTRARSRLADLDWAREELVRGTYGSCLRCGNPIALERLEAFPAAQYCVACASSRR